MTTKLRRTLAAAVCAAGLVTAAVAAPPAASAATPDGPSGPVVYDRGLWYEKDTPSGGSADRSFSFGRRGSALDVPVVGDWNGDGSETVGIARADGNANTFTWFLRNANSAGPSDRSFTFGQPGLTEILRGTPIAGNFDPSDDAYEVGYVIADTTGTLRWTIRLDLTASSPTVTFAYGHLGDTPVVGDWNGDGADTAGIVRGKQWMQINDVLSGGSPDTNFPFGATASRIREVPIVGDWNGDGVDSPGLLRNIPASNPEGRLRLWLYRNSNNTGGADGSFIYGSDAFRVGVDALFVPRLTIDVS
ncbi:hypothetical protein [Cryptosporangium sp. NPDC051539]|uniref:hypothetical protein n=1 Tax=Cryptosporangium sp. NPDC051539 TaxID=3363962 RepID=UPI00378A2691